MAFKLDLGKYTNIIEKQVKEWINDWLQILEKDIEINSPIDTGEYIEWNLKTEAIQVWTQIKGSVFNQSENANEVEYGFRSTGVTWSKKWGSPIVEIWRWARVYTKAYDSNEKEIKRIIRKKINLW